MNAGLPEITIALLVLIFYLPPLAAAVWALVTLHRLRSGQEAVNARLDAIERLLRQP